ncbi:MAG: response regulator [Pseudomonadota bacterium]
MKTNEVLIVDDNDSLRKALARIFEAYFKQKGVQNYKIHTADSADNALEIIKANTAIMIVLTDIMMPGMSGVDFLRSITHDIRRGIQVIMMTGQSNLGRVVDSFRNGAADYISKPFDISAIYEILDRNITKLEHWEKIIKEAGAAVS